MPTRILERAKRAEHSFMVVLAVTVGCLGGVGAVLFRGLIGLVQEVAWGPAPFSLALVRSHPSWHTVLVPALGGLIVGPLVYYFAREAKGHGVPEVMEAVAIRAGVIRPRLVVVKSLASAISIGTGGSVGRDSLPLPPWLMAAVGGLAVGVIGLAYPHVFGVGYETIMQALRGEMALGMLGVLLVLKIVATSITIGSGGSGGVFAPSLFIGAMAGGTVGTLAHRWLPEIAASPGAYALVGMGALVAGTTHAPLTAVLIIFELTSDYKLIVPLMAACMLSTLIATRLSPASIYTLKLLRRGTDMRRGKDLNVLRALEVADVMDRDAVTVPAEQSVGELIGLVAEHPQSCFYVAGEDQRLEGVIALDELRKALSEVKEADSLVARDLARSDLCTLSPAQDLDTVMRIFAGKNREELPVAENGKLVGIVTRQHLLDAYNEELLKRDMVSELSSSLTATATEEVNLGGGIQMAEIDAPGVFLGRSIRDLDVRARFGAHILLLRRPSQTGGEQELEINPEPDTVVARSDRLVLVGLASTLKRLRGL